MLTTAQLNDLKKSLPRGYLKKLVEKTGLSERTVSYFLSGETYRIDIHEAAIQIAEEELQKSQALIDRQKHLKD